MIKTRINNEYKDIIKIFGGGTLQKEIIKVWSGEAQEYVYESSVEYTGSLPITINANSDVLIDYRIYGADGGVGEQTESGEPAGYKLPMTVYKQEFVVTSDMLNQSNWVISSYWFIYFDISDFISKEACIAKIYENFSAGYTPEKLVVALTDAKYELVDTKYRILTNYGKILNKEFDFSSWDKIYLCIGYGDGYGDAYDKQSKINELFGNWKILIAPVSQTQTTPVYIGENKLDSVEGVSDYVDKLSGKIIRRIAEYTFTGEESFNKYGNSDVFYTSKTIDPVGITTVNTITMRCNHPAFTAIENKDTRYWLNPEADDICCFLPGGMSQVFLRSTSNFTTAAECKAYLKAQYDNDTPVKISYWLKTPIEEDPPVPLPEIPTIDGTTIIDYDGDPKPSEMYVKYRR